MGTENTCPRHDNSKSGNFVSFGCRYRDEYNGLATIFFNTQVAKTGTADSGWCGCACGLQTGACQVSAARGVAVQMGMATLPSCSKRRSGMGIKEVADVLACTSESMCHLAVWHRLRFIMAGWGLYNI